MGGNAHNRFTLTAFCKGTRRKFHKHSRGLKSASTAWRRRLHQLKLMIDVSDQPKLPGKRDVATTLLEKGTAFVHLDPRGGEVVVPTWLKEQPQLVLQVGLNMPIPILDLRVDAAGLHGTLSFNRQPFTCSVPWETVFAVVGDDGRGMVWPESMPAEIAAEVDREAARNHVPIPDAVGEGDESSPALRVADISPPRISENKRPMPLRTDAELPDGSFRVRSRPPRAPETPETPSMAPVDEAQGGNGRPSRPSSRPRGRVQLPPYLRVVK